MEYTTTTTTKIYPVYSHMWGKCYIKWNIGSIYLHVGPYSPLSAFVCRIQIFSAITVLEWLLDQGCCFPDFVGVRVDSGCCPQAFSRNASFR